MRKFLLTVSTVIMLATFTACDDSSSGGSSGGGGTVGESNPSITNAQLGVYCSYSDSYLVYDVYLYYYSTSGNINKQTVEQVFENATYAQYEYQDLLDDAQAEGYYDIIKDGNKVFYSENFDGGPIDSMRDLVNAGGMDYTGFSCSVIY